MDVGREMSPEPKVGIFWLVGGKLMVDVTPTSHAETYGECLGHAKGHFEYWTELQHAGVISQNSVCRTAYFYMCGVRYGEVDIAVLLVLHRIRRSAAWTGCVQCADPKVHSLRRQMHSQKVEGGAQDPPRFRLA